jgi:hypothetical protein
MLRLSVFSIEPGAINYFGRLHGLVQYVIRRVAPSAISPRLDCSQLWGLKHYTLGRTD